MRTFFGRAAKCCAHGKFYCISPIFGSKKDACRRPPIHLVHMCRKEAEHLLRRAAEVVVAVLEAVRRVLDPVQLLLRARYEIEGRLPVSGLRVHASSFTWIMRSGIFTAAAQRFGVISAAVKLPIFSSSQSISSWYCRMPNSSPNASKIAPIDTTIGLTMQRTFSKSSGRR